MRFQRFFLTSALMALLIAALPWSSAQAKDVKITFTSRPYVAPAKAASGAAGRKYLYDADAVADNGGKLRYSLRFGPNGMAVDPQTGIVDWKPSEVGHYVVEIRAELVNDPTVTAQQGWTIEVTGCASTGIISGMVQYDNGTTVTSGTITARMVGSTSSPLARVQGNIVNGAYSLTVDKGTYVLEAKGPFQTEWYKNSPDFLQAERLMLGCGEQRTADFRVAPVPSPGQASVVSGRVIDVATQSPVAGATVVIRELDREGAGEKWRRMIFPQGAAEGFSTDENGYYRGHTGIAYSGREYLVSVREGGYEHQKGHIQRQFFSLTPNPAEARALKPDPSGTTPDVNFLVRFPGTSRDVRIQVLDTMTNNAKAAIVIWRVTDTTDGLEIDPFRSFTTYADGDVSMETPGLYLVMALPQDPGYLPGYFVVDDTATASIGKATLLALDDEWDPSETVDLWLRPRIASEGISDLRGKVRASQNLIDKRGISPQSGAQGDLPGATVVAYDEAGRVAGFTFSEEDGTYLLEGLAAGTYTVVSEKIGLDPDSTTVVVSGLGEIVESDMLLEGAMTSGVEPIDGRRLITATLSPNPVSSTTLLRFDGDGGHARMSVTALDGREVLVRTIETVDGPNELSLDLATLPNGRYQVIVTGETTAASVPVTVSR